MDLKFILFLGMLFAPSSWGDNIVNGGNASSAPATVDKCEEFFNANPDARQFARKRDPRALDIISEIVKDQIGVNKAYCAWGGIQSTADQALDVWDTVKSQTELKTRLIRVCDEDPTPECKLSIAAQAPVAYGSMDPEHIRKISTYELLRTVERYQSLKRDVDGSNKSQEILKLKTKNPDKLTNNEKLQLTAFNENAAKRQEENKKKVAASVAAVKAAMAAAGVKLECYNPQKSRELFCYGLAYVVDPLSVGGAAIKALRVAAKLRASANTAEYLGRASYAIREGENFLVPRSSGGYSIGEVTEIRGDLVKLKFHDGSAPGKIVKINELKDVGSEVAVPKSGGGFYHGRISDVLPDGRVRVDFVDAQGSTILSPSDLRPSQGGYAFQSKKVADYKSGGGQTVVVDYGSGNIQSAMRETMDTFNRNGVSRAPAGEPPSIPKMERAANAWLKQAKQFEHKPAAGENYGSERDRRLRENDNKVTVGGMMTCQIAVCRELSVFGSIAFAELGYTTRVVRGTIPSIGGKPGGGHAWIEFLDPRTGKVVGLVDSNYTQRFYANPNDYYRETGAQVLSYHTIAQP